jgi:drug/metabolite transporter (DMT)-like permease
MHTKNKMNTQYLGFVSAIISAIITGCFGVLVRNVSAEGDVIAFSRFGLGFLCLMVYLLLSKRWQTFNIRISAALFSSGVFLALCVLFYCKAIKTTTLANAVFLLYLAPLIASVLGYFFLREKISGSKAILIICTFFGSLFLLDFDFSLGKTISSGQLFGLAAALCYAFFIIANRKIAPTISGFSRAFYQLLISSSVLLLFTGQIDLQTLYRDGYWLLAIGFLQGFIALTLMILSLRHLQAYEYATVSYLEPIIATTAGYLIYDESLSWFQTVGCVLILASGILQIRSSILSPERGN